MTLRVYLILDLRLTQGCSTDTWGERIIKGMESKLGRCESPARYYFSEALGPLPGGHSK